MDNNTPQNTNMTGAPIAPMSPIADPSSYLTPEPKKSKKTLVIIVAAVVLLFGIILTVTLLLSSNTPKDNDGADVSKISSVDFDKLTKEQAIEFVKKSYGKNVLPDGLIDSKLKLKDGLKAYSLLYSYENESDIPKIANESIMNAGRDETYPLEQRFTVEKIDDLYSIVTPTDKIANGVGDIRFLGICFNKEYVDFHEEDKIDSDGRATVEMYLTFKKLDKATVMKGLKLYAVTEVYGRLVHSYEVQDLENEYKIKVNMVGVGVTSLNTTANHTIDTYYMSWSVDKKTGVLDADFVRQADYSRNYIVNSFDLNEKEYNELAEIMSNTGAGY